MAEAIVLRVAKLLDDFPKDGKLWGVGGEFDQLKKTVSFLQHIVPDAENRSLRDWKVNRWLRGLRDAFYDAEDLLEEWNLEVMQLRESPSKHEMSARTWYIRNRTEAIAAKGRVFGLRECAKDVQAKRGSRNRERLDSFVYDEEKIGRESDQSAIKKFLLDSDTDEQISVLSIWGKSGIGKTALARCLCKDDMVKKHFDLRIWIWVGDDFRNLEKKLRKISGRETRERADDLLRLQKYLLVIDDLRSAHPMRWRSLKSLLMGGAQGSKTLITTGFQSVADLTSTSPSYCLEALPIESSFHLLMRMACQEEEETRNPIKVDVGRRIVKKCHGVPLAIRLIGSLFFKKTEAEWLHFEDEISKFSADFWDLDSILYIYLPCHLKQCFAFCSLFPKDWVIDKLMLTRGTSFNDCTKDELGNVMSCKMHDLVNDLACRVTNPEYQRIDDLLMLFGGRARRFLRALVWQNSGIEKLPSSICELKHLTFLDVSENKAIVTLPDSMTRLRTLQVLKLNMCCKLIELPRDIRKLVNLRHLEISNCNALSYMPQGMGKLSLLRTLTDFILPGDNSCPKSYSRLGELNRLNNLKGNLRIEVKGEIKDAVANSDSANLKQKDYLVSLVLVFPGKESDEILLQELQPSLNLRSLEIEGYGSTRFPSWMSCTPKLVQLQLYDCAGCKSLPSLGELTSLKHLEIGELPIAKYTESDIHTPSSLPNLSTLRIWECPNLERIPPLLHLKELKPPSFPLEPLQNLVATTEHVIGIDNQVKDVINLLEIEDDKVEVRIVGIHGTDGIGKTTIVKAVYDQPSSCFDSCSFLAEIGETTRNVGGIQFVQTKLICDVLEQDGDVASFKGGIKFFQDVFRTIKVLIILDDVEEHRIIVTLENVGILQTYVSQGLACLYEVNGMDNDRALELFHKHALGSHFSTPGYPEVGKHIVKATGQVPFVIEVIGSFLRGKTIEDWRKIEDLIKPQNENSQEILKDCRGILKFCYKALDEKQKQIFWDIAWFANGVDSRIASYMWPDQDLLPSHHVLMILAKIGGDNMLWMHKLLKRLSRTIDQEEPIYPGRRSRQYIHVTDMEVINRKEGMEEVEALCFDFKNLRLHMFTETDFKSMPNIRFLKLIHANCPRDLETADYSLNDLVILDLSWSKITKDWEGWGKIKMERLKVLSLTSCTDLLISSTFSSFPNLEILILERCSRLVYLDPSVGDLKQLLCLNLKSCTELNMLPAEVDGLEALKELLIDETSVRDIPLGGDSKKLETLSASNCLSLSLLPHSFEHLTSLSILQVDNSNITELSDGVGELVKLRRLSLRNCHWIRELPESIGQLGRSLEELDISGTGISELPDSFGHLQSLRVLNMNNCFISKFPSSVWSLLSLEEINASSCTNLEGEIPGDIKKLINLRILKLRYSPISSLPPEIMYLSKLETLDLLQCDMLHELSALPSSLFIVHLSPKLKEKVSNLLR
ncbi:hypothetical protein BT93_E2036 [Corymbia citriodora subsp. variegata]|nr:hypothetical protein BT93_E2036 [Corymbia citriodora subsp. variegata]